MMKSAAKSNKEPQMGEQGNYFEKLFKASADGIILTDAEGYITDANKSIEEMLGYSRKELQGRHTSGLLPFEMENRDFTKHLIEQLKNNEKKNASIEHKWMRKDGSPISVELNIALLKDSSSDIIGTISNVRDVSVRMEIEDELKQRNRELLILNTIISFLNRYLNIGELLDNALEKVLEIMKIESGALLLLDDEEKKFTVEESKGFSPGFVAQISTIDLEENVIGETVGSGDVFLLEENPSSNMPYAQLLLSENMSSLLFLPIKTKDMVYGMMIYGHRHSRFFSENETRLVKNIGYQIAISIENAILFKKVKESEAKYRHLSESANIGIVSFNKEGKIFQFNKKAEDIFGFSRDEIIDSIAMKILPVNHKELYKKISDNYITSRKNETLGQPIIAEGRSKDDRPISLEISYSVWGDKLNPIITATIRDL
jgi:PAS domain S-box-containing protein